MNKLFKSSLDESNDFLDESDAPLDDVDREASPHRVWYRIFSSSLASRTRTANGVTIDRIPFALALLAGLNRVYARVVRACTHSAVMMRMTRGSPVQRTCYQAILQIKLGYGP